ncbi:MAG: peptidyl-prolyl cis-trans isomerase [Deltaproteobacteria bacterium]|uniref:peptidylprolyl isomerase n=1 Tax=Candidatus Zymogenus saltonus TaxID=2844893 RepID=A0A9D8KFM9_9DELT|nr:peptidyl-prolyl cis-trans isomerase [Candidatus Zymogenus saltonus]
MNTRKFTKTASRLVFILLSVIVLIVAAGCGKDKASKEDEREVLAVVGDKSITTSEFEKAIKDLKAKLPSGEFIDEEKARGIKLNLLNQLIEKRILITEAEKLGITVSEKEIDSKMKELTSEYNSELEKLRVEFEKSETGENDSTTFEEWLKDKEIAVTFEDWLEEKGIDIEQWRKESTYQILLEKLVEEVIGESVEVSKEEIKEYYTENQEDYNRPVTVRALQIMVDTEEKAKKLLEEIEGGRDFSEVARANSISPDAQNGGDLGYFSKDQMPPFVEVVFDMKPNELSGIIASPYGYHIFKVIDIRDAKNMTLDEAEAEIKDKLKRKKIEEAYGEWFSEIKNKTKIEVNPAVLEKIKM